MDQPRAQEGNQSTVKDGFGVHLRREREMRGVTLEEISSATRIGTRFLDALETEHWDRLPGGVFNRGFVRTTAQFLGLDPEAMLAEYTLATTDSTRPAPPVYIHSQSSWTPRTAPVARDRRWLPWIVLIAMAAIAAGGWFGLKRYEAMRLARAAGAANADTPGADSADNSGAASDASATASPATRATPDAPSASAQPHASQAAGDSSPAPDTSASASAAAPSSANDAAANPAEATAPASAAATPAATASAPASVSGPLVLKIEAGRATTVKVSVDGHKTFQGKIPAGGSKTFQANEVFYVTARDAGGVLLELNGQTLPPLGPQGRSGSIRLTRDSLKSQDGTNH